MDAKLRRNWESFLESFMHGSKLSRKKIRRLKEEIDFLLSNVGSCTLPLLLYVSFGKITLTVLFRGKKIQLFAYNT